ncbi:MAG: uracil-DNA glycosylase, partial [Panacagrimonas sp.]
MGEAIGYQGGRYSGIAFTSERLLAEGAIPRMEATGRITQRDLPFSEPSATIVWRELAKLGLAAHTVLWNALSLHPHLPEEPWSNRTPTRREFEMGLPALERLLAAFPQAQVIAVGRNSQ